MIKRKRPLTLFRVPGGELPISTRRARHGGSIFPCKVAGAVPWLTPGSSSRLTKSWRPPTRPGPERSTPAMVSCRKTQASPAARPSRSSARSNVGPAPRYRRLAQLVCTESRMTPAYFHITTGASAEQKGKNRPITCAGARKCQLLIWRGFCNPIRSKWASRVLIPLGMNGPGDAIRL